MELLEVILTYSQTILNETLAAITNEQTLNATLAFGEQWGHILASTAGALTLILILRARKRKLAAKKTALTLLKVDRQTLSPSGAMEIVRQACMCYFPKNHISALSGPAWIEFLDKQVGRPLFKTKENEWQMALKCPSKLGSNSELVELCETWINDALPPRR